MDKFEALAPTKHPDDPSVAKWKEVVKKHYPSDTFMTWHLFGIASGEFVVAALKKAGRDLTRESLAKALSDLTVETPAYPGPISCKPDNHQCYRSMAWFSLRGPEMKQVGTTVLK
jgi:branched-chain amino acid transport system substrate-binding protein